ncbi:hypothetical protein Tco_1503389 [Tanacetum coccineum]
MITGKWTTFARDCNNFARIVEEHARLSAWDVLKNHHKRRGVKAIILGRSVRTADDIEEPDELFRGDTITRPLGSQGLRRVKNPTRPDPRNHIRWEEML